MKEVITKIRKYLLLNSNENTLLFSNKKGMNNLNNTDQSQK